MIHAIHLHADPTLIVIMESAHVYLNIKAIHTLDADPNVYLTTIAQEIRLALGTNVSIHVLEHAVKMRFVKSSITFLCAHVLKA